MNAPIAGTLWSAKFAGTGSVQWRDTLPARYYLASESLFIHG
jgi:hypothetical protein